jgi:hypothetical protein
MTTPHTVLESRIKGKIFEPARHPRIIHRGLMTTLESLCSLRRPSLGE